MWVLRSQHNNYKKEVPPWKEILFEVTWQRKKRPAFEWFFEKDKAVYICWNTTTEMY